MSDLIRIIILILQILMIFFLLATYEKVSADDVSILCCTYHSYQNKDFNDFNPGVIYRHFPDESGAFALVGGYYNSWSRGSVAAGAGYEWDLTKWLDVSVAGGLVTGYPDRALRMFVIPTVTVVDRVNFNLIPIVHKEGTGFGVNLSFRAMEF